MARPLGRRQRQLLAMIKRHRAHGFYVADLYGSQVRLTDHADYLKLYKVARRLEARGLLTIVSYAYGTPRLFIHAPGHPPIGRPWDAVAHKMFGKQGRKNTDVLPHLLLTREAQPGPP